jgi:hypothetical protein
MLAEFDWRNKFRQGLLQAADTAIYLGKRSSRNRAARSEEGYLSPEKATPQLEFAPAQLVSDTC